MYKHYLKVVFLIFKNVQGECDALPEAEEFADAQEKNAMMPTHKSKTCRGLPRRLSAGVIALIAMIGVILPGKARAQGWPSTTETTASGLSPVPGGYRGIMGWTTDQDCEAECMNLCPDPSNPVLCTCNWQNPNLDFCAATGMTPWQDMSSSPVVWFTYTPVNPQPGQYPPAAHSITTEDVAILGIRTQSPVTANDPDGYIVQANGPPQVISQGTTHMFPASVTQLTLSDHESTNWQIRFGLILAPPTAPVSQVMVTPIIQPTFTPLAEAGPNQTVNPGQITLDASASSHPGGAPLTYFWSPVGSGPAVIQNTSNPYATVQLENLAGLGGTTTYEFQVEVTEAAGGMSDTDTMTATVSNLYTQLPADPVLTPYDPDNPADPWKHQSRSMQPGSGGGVQQPALRVTPQPVTPVQPRRIAPARQ